MKEEHPHLLPWYVSGTLSPRDRREIEGHLRECGSCREEAASLASMMKSVRIQSRVDHVEAAALALYEEAPLSLDAARRAALEDHLAECAGCRGDLATLRLARVPGAPATAGRLPRTSHGARRAGLAAAAAAVMVLGLAALWPFRFQPVGPETPHAEIRSVVFAAPRRGAEARRTLQAPGPWSIRVLLPFGSREGRYRVDFRRIPGPILPSIGTAASTDSDLCLTVPLHELPSPGRYEMLLRPEGDPAGDPLRYPFDLIPGTGSGPDR